MRDDVRGDSGLTCGVSQGGSKPNAEHLTALRTWEQEFRRSLRGQCSEERQPRDDGSNLFVHRDETIIVQFADRDMQRSLLVPKMTQTVGGQINCFAQTHAS